MTTCPVGRTYNENHATCKTCKIDCPARTVGAPAKPPEQPVKKREPNNTEAEYGLLLEHEFPGCKVKFEALSLKLDNGLKYTPDWLVVLPAGAVLCVEVKNGGFKHASYGRSRMAFLQAVIDWPMFSFRWAVKNDGQWRVENHVN